jgi:cytochrome c
MLVQRLLLASCLAASCLSGAWAAGDPVNGQKLYAARCMACHTIDASIAGPAHRGVVGRKAGSVPGFDYSPALKKSGVVWNERNLDRWLSNPETFIPGQRMFYAVPDAAERADLIAYLKTQR